jgi:hypothetical protein
MPLPIAIITGIIELGKLGLQAWFQANRLTGRTDEEIDAMYIAEELEFEQNAPVNLPDVPADIKDSSTTGGGGSTEVADVPTSDPKEVADAGPDTP